MATLFTIQTNIKCYLLLKCPVVSHSSILYLDISDETFHNPLPLLLSVEVEAGEPLLLAEDKVVGAHHQQVAVNLLVDLLLYPG